MSDKFVLKRIFFDIMAPSDWEDDKCEETLNSEVFEELDDAVKTLLEDSCWAVSKELTVQESTRKL